VQDGDGSLVEFAEGSEGGKGDAVVAAETYKFGVSVAGRIATG
jgi:hypothetical protein